MLTDLSRDLCRNLGTLQVQADLLILLTDVEGVYDKHPKEPGAKVRDSSSVIPFGCRSGGSSHENMVFILWIPCLAVTTRALDSRVPSSPARDVALPHLQLQE